MAELIITLIILPLNVKKKSPCFFLEIVLKFNPNDSFIFWKSNSPFNIL